MAKMLSRAGLTLLLSIISFDGVFDPLNDIWIERLAPPISLGKRHCRCDCNNLKTACQPPQEV